MSLCINKQKAQQAKICPVSYEKIFLFFSSNYTEKAWLPLNCSSTLVTLREATTAVHFSKASVKAFLCDVVSVH